MSGYIGSKTQIAVTDSYTKAQSEDTFAPITRSRKNKIINGNFDIWQRGTSFTDPSSGDYTADRWTMGGFIGTVTREAFTTGQTNVPNEPTYFFRKERTSAGTGLNAIAVQRIESVRTLAGKQATLSFWAKADTAKTIVVDFNQEFGSGGTPSDPADTAGKEINLTTSWQKFVYTDTLPSISGKTLGTNGDDKLEARFLEDSGFSTYIIDIAQVQLEEGDVATDFEQRPIGEELALCERYYQKIDIAGLNGYASSEDTLRFNLQARTLLRGVPSASLSTNSPDVFRGNASSVGSGSSVTFQSISREGGRGLMDVFSSFTALDLWSGRVLGQYIILDAEL